MPVLIVKPPLRRLLLVSIAVPLLAILALLAFAWPSARLAPRDLPLGIVGTGPAAQHAVAALTDGDPGAFDFHSYADDAAARRAIRDRDVYGVLEITDGAVSVLEASAASPVVAQLVSTAAEQLGTRSGARVSVVDLVPTAPGDPRGAVLSSALLPLIVCGLAVAAGLGMVARTSGWQHLVALIGLSALAGLGAYLIAQSLLGALPHQHVATWAALSLTVLAVSGSAAGLLAVLGPAGLGVSALLMIFLGNPFSGATSAPELLPHPVDDIGQWLPPGAAASLLRSTAYFDGNGATAHVIVLGVWAVLGLAAAVFGQHVSVRLILGRSRSTTPAPADLLRPDLLRPDLDARRTGGTDEEATTANPRHADVAAQLPAAASQVG